MSNFVLEYKYDGNDEIYKRTGCSVRKLEADVSEYCDNAEKNIEYTISEIIREGIMEYRPLIDYEEVEESQKELKGIKVWTPTCVVCGKQLKLSKINQDLGKCFVKNIPIYNCENIEHLEDGVYTPEIYEKLERILMTDLKEVNYNEFE